MFFKIQEAHIAAFFITAHQSLDKKWYNIKYGVTFRIFEMFGTI